MPPPNLLTTYLADTDEPCPNCGYNLRSLHGNNCPECNRALQLGVVIPETNRVWYMAAVIALSSGIGFNVFVLAHLARVMASHYTPTWSDVVDDRLYLYPLSFLVLSSSLAVLLLRRRSVCRLPSLAQSAIAISSFAFTIPSFVQYESYLFH